MNIKIGYKQAYIQAYKHINQSISAPNLQHSLSPPNSPEEGVRRLLGGSPGLGSGCFQWVAACSRRGGHIARPDPLLSSLGGAAARLDDGHHVGHNVTAELGIEIANGHLLGRAVQADTGQEGRLPLLLDALGGTVGDSIDAALDLALQVLQEQVDLGTAGTVDARGGNFNGIRVGIVGAGGGTCSGGLGADGTGTIGRGGIIVHRAEDGALDRLTGSGRAGHG